MGLSFEFFMSLEHSNVEGGERNRNRMRERFPNSESSGG
jgi:hypothetical protein